MHQLEWVFLLVSDDDIPGVKLNLCSIRKKGLGELHNGYCFCPSAGVIGVKLDLHNKHLREKLE